MFELSNIKIYKKNKEKKIEEFVYMLLCYNMNEI